MPKGQVPRYKVIRCKTCDGVIARFDRSKYPGEHVPVDAIMKRTRRHYKDKHPGKWGKK